MSESRNKIIMLGDSGVGKTALVTRWIKGQYKNDQRPTIGAAYSQASFEKDGEVHKIQVWDTAGEEKYRSMAPIYSQGAFGALIVFDLTNRESLEHIREWVNCLDTTGGIPIVVCGNKSDLEDERKVDMDEALAVVGKMGYCYFETSACTGNGVDEAFSELIQKALSERTKKESAESVTLDSQPEFENPTERKQCC